MSTPAGWYDDGKGRQRWWDGSAWTDRFADQAPQDQAPPLQPAAAQSVALGTADAAFATPLVAAPTPKRRPHALGIVALATAVLGFIFACIPGALIVGWVLLPIAFILSIIGLFMKGTKWPAITALIVAIVGTIVGFVVFFAMLSSAASDAFDRGTTNSGVPSSSGPAASTPSSEAESATSDYAVTIDGATQTKDYKGKPALQVDYTFTNNSKDDANFMFAVQAKAFQNGIELEDAVVTSDGDYMQNSLKDIKPGKSIHVQWAYVLDDKTDVTVEVTELMSFDDTLLTTKVISVK